MTIKTTREGLDTTIGADGMQREYLALPEEERAKGFIRPLRFGYRHVGAPGPEHPLRDLDASEAERYQSYGYVKYEAYPVGAPIVGRFWTQAQLDAVGKGCGATTKMARPLAETYARQPDFYGATFCSTCGSHFPVGASGAFVWEGTDERVGT